MKPKYYTMVNRQPQFHTSRAAALKVSEQVYDIPAGLTHYSVEHRYPDITQIAWHIEGRERMGHLIKEIA
ncbi:MAG TPA: hypothetical protein DCS09_11080 [Porphyromonadaceae bacterium]|nr:hypothetical protein [Porphyromonadaceae bacterium]